MEKTNDKGMWVAVRVQRGFISDILAFRDKRSACQKEASWRRIMNPDYDETAVSYVHIDKPGSGL
jgi:hypothetical protein